MISQEIYNFEVLPGTRNHKGCFVQEVSYKLIEINAAGWALICLNNTTCHYIDPEHLQEILK